MLIDMEKHAWLSAGLIWLPHASDSGAKGSDTDSQYLDLQSTSLNNGKRDRS